MNDYNEEEVVASIYDKYNNAFNVQGESSSKTAEDSSKEKEKDLYSFANKFFSNENIRQKPDNMDEMEIDFFEVVVHYDTTILPYRPLQTIKKSKSLITYLHKYIKLILERSDRYHVVPTNMLYYIEKIIKELVSYNILITSLTFKLLIGLSPFWYRLHK